MDLMLLGIIGVVAALLFIALGVPVAMALGAIGIIGYIVMAGFIPALQQIVITNWVMTTSIVICCIPLFIFMGQLVFHCGVATDLYFALFRWLGRLPGGLAIATAFSCAAFGSVSGSSVATVATMGSIAIPEMKKYEYDNVMAVGCLTASGTMGTMIPPSTDMIIYGILTEVSIGRLFVAGFFPGILEAVTYSIMMLFRCIRNPRLGPRGPSFPIRAKLVSLTKVIPVLIIFLMVLGGIYGGVFTPTEAGGAGAFFALVVVLTMRRLNLKRYWSAVLDTGRITAMLIALIVGGLLFSKFLVLTGVTPAVVNFIVALPVNRFLVLGGIFVLYIILGAAMNVTTMLILTVPLTYPVMLSLGFDGIWFGIMCVKMCEIGMITPPVGANLYVMKSIAPEVPMTDIFRGVIPFFFVDLSNIVILVLFPQIALWLPSTMF